MAKITRLALDESGKLEHRRLHLREISDDADRPLETVGQDLRAARQRKGEDLATVSKVLKIRKDHLEAVEESELDALPGRAYALGFVRSYAEYLGLDALAIVERFKQEIAGRSPDEEGTLKLTLPEERRLPQGSIVFVILLLIAAVYGGYYVSVSANRMLNEPVTPVPASLAEESSVTASSPAPATTAPAETTLAVAAVKAPTAALPSPLKRDAVAAASSAPSKVPAVSATGREFGKQNVGSRIELRVHRATRVLVQGPNNTVYINRTLLAGDVYHAPNLVGLALSTPDGGAVEVILDGTSMGYVGRPGVVAEGLSLNPQAIVDRHNGSRSQPG